MLEENSFSYYNLIMGDTKQSIKYEFHTRWLTFLDNLYEPYGTALQLRIGSHLRPLLVYWGGALGAEKVEKMRIEDITELAICIEILHKTSIIVDDLIDGDIQRHSKSAFHIQFSPDETIIFAVYMLGTAFAKIFALSQKYAFLQTPFVTMYAQTLCEMATGCLSELTLTQEKRYNYETIVTIMQKETSTLIKNSFLMGFLTNDNLDQNVIVIIERIGEKVGYLFQAMNDMEPFCDDRNLTQHKGTLNFDFNRSRKNIVLPYIYGRCSISEKNKLLEDKKVDTTLLLNLYQKYQIGSIIKDDLDNIQRQLEIHFSELEKMQVNQMCLTDFKRFYYEIMQIAKKRLTGESIIPID